MIRAEYEPGGSHVGLNLCDDTILVYVQDEARAGAALREADPVKWFVGTIAVAEEGLPSRVEDEALLTKVILSERSIDPIVHTEVRQYLRSKGFSWISGCFG